MIKSDLQRAVLDALAELGGTATVTEIAKVIWHTHEADLRASGDLFFTWQYDMRWAGQLLQKRGLLRKGSEDRKWALL